MSNGPDPSKIKRRSDGKFDGYESTESEATLSGVGISAASGQTYTKVDEDTLEQHFSPGQHLRAVHHDPMNDENTVIDGYVAIAPSDTGDRFTVVDNETKGTTFIPLQNGYLSPRADGATHYRFGNDPDDSAGCWEVERLPQESGLEVERGRAFTKFRQALGNSVHDDGEKISVTEAASNLAVSGNSGYEDVMRERTRQYKKLQYASTTLEANEPGRLVSEMDAGLDKSLDVQRNLTRWNDQGVGHNAMRLSFDEAYDHIDHRSEHQLVELQRQKHGQAGVDGQPAPVRLYASDHTILDGGSKSLMIDSKATSLRSIDENYDYAVDDNDNLILTDKNTGMPTYAICKVEGTGAYGR